MKESVIKKQNSWGREMINREQPPLVPFLDEQSQAHREWAECRAESRLKDLQKKDDRFNDPMTAYKYLKESAMSDY